MYSRCQSKTSATRYRCMILVVDTLHTFDKEEMSIFPLFGNLKLGEKVLEVVSLYFSKTETGREISKVSSHNLGMSHRIATGLVDEMI